MWILCPQNITVAVVSPTNLGGTTTNSNLDQAGVEIQFALWEKHFIPRHRTLLVFNDNALVVSWLTRMADRSTSNIAGRLLQGLAYLF